MHQVTGDFGGVVTRDITLVQIIAQDGDHSESFDRFEDYLRDLQKRELQQKEKKHGRKK